MRRALALVSAFLAGAAGLGLEILLLECAGLALGQGRAGAWGLALFVAGWALGAFCAGRLRAKPAPALFLLGVVLLFAAPCSVLLVLHAATFAEQWQADLLACGALAAAAFAQGFFLPLLLRGRNPAGRWSESAAALVAANLAGSLAGAWILGVQRLEPERFLAGECAGGLALGAGIAGALALRGEAPPARASGPIAWRAGVAIAFATLWTLALEYTGLRLAVLWIGGMQFALGAAIAASVCGLALGAALLPPLLPRGERGVLVLLALALVASVWPSLAHLMLARVDPAADPLGLARAALLLGPALLPLGAFPAVLHRTLDGDGGERLGALYLHEAWGALLGLPLLHAFVLPRLGLQGLLASGALAGLAIAWAFARASRVLAGACAALALGACLFVFAAGPPALRSPPLAQPALELRSFTEDRDFAVSVVDDGILGERTLLTDGFRAAGTSRDYLYMQVLGHLPLLLHPHPERVAVLALGTGTTLGAVAQHPEVRSIELLEISRAVVDAAPFFEAKNHGVLGPAAMDPRLLVQLGDGRRTLANHPASYDVLTMEPLLPDSPFGVYLYTQEFYAIARRALAPGGLLCQWVPPHALEPRTFQAVLRAFEESFPWSGVWVFGTQVILVGGEAAPDLLPARFDPSLAYLGLDTPQALAARCVRASARHAGEGQVELAPPLTDGEPWILYLPRRSGAVLLGDLPANLGAWHGTPKLPERWHADPNLVEAFRALRHARELFAVEEARLRGLDVPPEPGAAAELARATRLAPLDPEVQAFVEEREFLVVLRRGVSQLASDPQAALPDLVRAAELRGERADVHLYLAVALERTGNPNAAKALRAARQRCPQIARTREGLRARQLGLSDAGWASLSAPAQDLR
ncbi:MAG: hypothetical protein IPJ19_13345 [Planctomycetes bacterium]|nr:hypothetical protein [Planctomycetota bacterium]